MKWRKFLRWPSAPDGQKAAESALRRAEAARKEAEDRQPAVSEAARTSERAQTQELLELSRTSAHALQALPRMGLEEDSEVDAR